MNKRKTSRTGLFVLGGVVALLTIICGGGGLFVRNTLTSFDRHGPKMCLRRDLDVRDSDLWFSPGMDSVMWCRMIVKAGSIDEVFDRARVDTTEFRTAGFGVHANGDPWWWDAGDYQLIGGSVELRKNQEYMKVGYVDQGDGTLLVFLLWYTV